MGEFKKEREMRIHVVLLLGLILLMTINLDSCTAECPFLSGKMASREIMSLGDVYDQASLVLEGLMAHVPSWVDDPPETERIQKSLDRLTKLRTLIDANQHPFLFQRDFQALVLQRVLHALIALREQKWEQAELLLERCSFEALDVGRRHPRSDNYDDLEMAIKLVPWCVEQCARVRTLLGKPVVLPPPPQPDPDLL